MNVLVLSIKPKYAEAIYSGSKHFEFRKVPPRNLNAVYLMYESAPVSKITGTVTFCASLTVRAHAMVGAIMGLMNIKKGHAISLMGITEKELIAYAGGPDKFVTALMVSRADNDSYYEQYHIRPPQNWGTIRFPIGPSEPLS